MAVDFGSAGLELSFGVGWSYIATGFSARNCGRGMNIYGSGNGILVEEPLIDGCPIGIFLEKASIELQDPEINNCTSKAFSMTQSVMEINGQIKGTGNAGFGLDASGVGNNIWLLSSAVPTIAGSLGDVSVDGVNAESWADLSAVGDYAVDSATGSRIIRR